MPKYTFHVGRKPFFYVSNVICATSVFDNNLTGDLKNAIHEQLMFQKGEQNASELLFAFINIYEMLTISRKNVRLKQRIKYSKQ